MPADPTPAADGDVNALISALELAADGIDTGVISDGQLWDGGRWTTLRDVLDRAARILRTSAGSEVREEWGVRWEHVAGAWRAPDEEVARATAAGDDGQVVRRTVSTSPWEEVTL